MNNGISLEEILKQLAQLQSENANLRILVADYQFIANTRAAEWRMISLKTNNDIPLQSNVENQLTEIKFLQEHVRDLQQKIEGGVIREHEQSRQSESTGSYAQQNDELKTQLHHLQCEITDMKEQLQRLYNQIFFLQHSASRIAELESLLLNAEEEIESLKTENKDN
jgi:hypothetical protein